MLTHSAFICFERAGKHMAFEGGATNAAESLSVPEGRGAVFAQASLLWLFTSVVAPSHEMKCESKGTRLFLIFELRMSPTLPGWWVSHSQIANTKVTESRYVF